MDMLLLFQMICSASARKPLGRNELAGAEHVLDLIAMHLPGSRQKEMKLASAEPLFELLATSLPGSR